MNKLELKYIAPYLPYELHWDISSTEYGKLEKHRLKYCKLVGLNFSNTHGDCVFITNIKSQNRGILYLNIDVGKPILRPLSDLTKEIKYNGDKFIPVIKLGWKLNVELNIEQTALGMWKCNYEYVESALIDIQLLFKWHFDVFGLIKKGLAIDINML